MQRYLLIIAIFLSGISFAQKKEEKVNMSKKSAVKSEVTNTAPSSESLQVKELNEVEEQEQSTQVISNRNKFNTTNYLSNNQRTQRNPTASQQQAMDEAVSFFKKNAPNSFEYHYYKYESGNYNVNRIAHLKQAEKLNPTNSGVIASMAAYYIIIGDEGMAKTYLSRMKGENQLTNTLIDYCTDVLISVPENGLLVTHGFDDTYGTWYAMQLNGIREDVTLVSLDFMQSEKYRERLKAKGVVIPDRQIVDVNFLTAFCNLNEKRNICVSLTTPKEYFLANKWNFYLVGLTYWYQKNELNNFKINHELWSNKLKKSLIQDKSQGSENSLVSNYLPMLFQLRKVYRESGQFKDASELEQVIDRIGQQCGIQEKVNKLKQYY